MATLYVGGRLFDGEKVQDGQAVLEEGGTHQAGRAGGRVQGFCRRAGRYFRGPR